MGLLMARSKLSQVSEEEDKQGGMGSKLDKNDRMLYLKNKA
ncbi:hypothetical protein [Aeromonas hydrophila]|nr:hypothetical protein [Aeromonas hydrophila]